MLDRRTLLAAAAALPLSPAALRAQGKWPDKPVRVIVPFGPGGLADVTMRVVGEKLGERLGQQVVVVNQPGAGGTAAARAALGAPADGYTLALLTNGTAIAVPLMANLGYDPVAEFRPVSALGFFDFLLLTGADQPYRTLADLLATAKAQPGKLNVGTINIGSTQNLTGQLLKTLAGIDVQIVPFRTTPDVMTALLRKDVDLAIDGFVAAKAQLADGKLRALAVTGPQRFAGLPDVPTVGEAGVKDFDVTSWNAVFAPRGTPDEVVAILNREIAAVLADPAVRQRLLELGIVARGGPPAEIGERLSADIRRWGEVIRAAGVPRQ
jgi:tripartite-type tricarboxylate transporter receptor subunit TctC